MDKKWLINKINEYKKHKDCDWDKIVYDEFLSWLFSKKKTLKLNTFSDFYNQNGNNQSSVKKIFDDHKSNKIKKQLDDKNLNCELPNKIESLLFEYKNKYVGSQILKSKINDWFDNKYDYMNVAIRQKVYSIISKLRNKFWNNWESSKEKIYIISGITMKNLLRIDREDDKIDGYCLTNNTDWILQYLEQRIKDLDEIKKHYKSLKNQIS